MHKRNKKSSGRSRGNRRKNADPVQENDSENKEGMEEIPSGSTYRVRHSPVMGRYLAAKKALKAGDVIISEAPIVVGPCQESKAVCLGCYEDIKDLLGPIRCEQCGWPMCSPKCPGLHTEFGHSENECKTLSKIPESERPSKVFDGVMYNAIVPLRCLLLRTAEPEKWQQLQRMQSLDELRRTIPKLWESNQTNVVNRIRNNWGFTEFTEDEIHTVCGYLEVNSFAIGQCGVSIRGLYPTSFLIAHDCVPNTSHIDADSFMMTIRASVPIEKGQALTLSYAHTLEGTMKRRQHLKETKFFDCACDRCSDRTELGTNFSAIKCSACEKGYLLPDDPLDNNSLWLCQANGCNVSMKPLHVLTIINRIDGQLERLKYEPIKDYEDFLRKNERVLHPNHYLIIGAKLSLSQMYGKIPGYLLQEMTNEQLQRKLEICRHIMRIIDLYEPGLTRIRGISLYELHAPLMVLTMEKCKTHSIAQKELKTSLREVVRLLREAYLILSFEPESSQEGSVCKAVKEALHSTEGWEKTMGKI